MTKQLQQFGKMLKELRIKKELSLRDIHKLTGYDPSNWSKVERGRLAPPKEKETLAKWARVLGLPPQNKSFREFIDCAQVAQGIIPSDVFANENAVRCMPAFFRTLRNKKPTKEEIDQLVKLIKNA